MVRIDLSEPTQALAMPASLLRIGQQLDQFIDDGFNGERGGSSDISFAVVEAGEYDESIYAYKDGSSGGSRIRGMYNCTTSGCAQTSNFPTAESHATRVAGLVFGDLQDGQDPNYTASGDRKDRSGFATEAHGYLYQISGGLTPAADHIAGLSSYQPILMNFSQAEFANPTCTGTTGPERSVNELFETGTLTFQAAGNSGHSSTTDCTVVNPGAAIGSFVVGAYGNVNSSLLSDVYNDGPCSVTARGGTSIEGYNRSIVDLLAYAPRSRMTIPGNAYSGGGCFTSYAAPAAAGAAIDFADHYFMTYSSVLDDPGLLHVAMLLMGDRTSQTGRLTSGFDNVRGAGKMRMRRWDNSGMDSPWGFGLGAVCVDNYTAVLIPINGSAPLPASVDVIKAVAYWYDRRHETGAVIDNIDLQLRDDGSFTLERSESDFDEKERVFYELNGDPGPYFLRLSAPDVSSDEAGCGADSMLVYYGYFYEDSARNDSNGPGSEILVE